MKGNESKERGLIGKLEFAAQREQEEGNGLNQGRGWHVRKNREEGRGFDLGKHLRVKN